MEAVSRSQHIKRFRALPEVDRHRAWQRYTALLLPVILLVGWLIFPPLGYVILGCMAAGIGYGVTKGRYWCDWMCPRGSFWDSYMTRLSFNGKVPGLFRHAGWRLLWIAIMMSVMGLMISLNWGNWSRMGMAPFLVLLTVTTVVGLIVGIIYNVRSWCMFCPIGSMAHFFGKGKQPLRVGADCLGEKCGQCYKVCRMQIRPGDYRASGTMQHGDCLKCSRCIEVCPKAALSWEE